MHQETEQISLHLGSGGVEQNFEAKQKPLTTWRLPVNCVLDILSFLTGQREQFLCGKTLFVICGISFSIKLSRLAFRLGWSHDSRTNSDRSCPVTCTIL